VSTEETKEAADQRHRKAERAVFGVTRTTALRTLLEKHANALQRTPARGLVARLIGRTA
jgi:hypothetical protein